MYTEVKILVPTEMYRAAAQAGQTNKTPVKAIFSRMVRDTFDLLNKNEEQTRRIIELEEKVLKMDQERGVCCAVTAQTVHDHYKSKDEDVIKIRKPLVDYYGNQIKYQ